MTPTAEAERTRIAALLRHWSAQVGDQWPGVDPGHPALLRHLASVFGLPGGGDLDDADPDAPQRPTVTYPAMIDHDGATVVCASCDRHLHVGMPYAERLLSVGDGAVLVEVVCVYDVTGGTA